MENKTKLIIKDFILNEMQEVEISQIYNELYKEYNEDIGKIFAFFHQNLNYLFSFMNDKAKYNRHYNADESRRLSHIINILLDLQAHLKGTEYEFLIDKMYLNNCYYCDSFLSLSGGSVIPETYVSFKIIKYEPIFFIENKVINKIKKENNFFEKKLIGEGAYALVYKYKDDFYDEVFALKKLKKGIIGKEKLRFENEFKILKEIKHPYILKVYSYNEEEDSYIMDYCDYTLKRYIEIMNGKKEFDFNKRKILVTQFLIGLEVLHNRGYLHRDISLNNILVKQYDSNIVLLKLSDFGLIKNRDLDLTRVESEIRGTIIDDTLKSFKDYNIKNEIYCIGIVIYFIFTGKTNLEIDERNCINKIVLKCVDRNITNRYDCVKQIIEDLKRL